MKLSPRNDPIRISGWLAAHFCADELTAPQVRQAYANAQNILNNAERFPRADFDTLERLSEELYLLSPIACDLGL